MVKKGLSLEEKRTKVLEIFHESDDVYQLKEIEKIAAGRGVTVQSVKEVVQSLVDDDLVHQEKIGIANFLWSFAAEASTKVKNDEARLTRELTGVKADAAKIAAQLDAARSRQEDADAKARLAAELEQLNGQKAALEEERAALEVVDPQRFEAMKEAAGVARDAANRWLDNTHALQQWCQKSFAGREKEVAKFFEENGLTDKMDYLT